MFRMYTLVNTFGWDHVQLSDGAANLPYVPVTIRVPEQVAREVRNFAKDSGWQLADFRTLI